MSDAGRWLAIRVEPSGDSQPIIDALFAAGSLGVQEDGSAVVTHFPPGTDPSSIEGAIVVSRVTGNPAPMAAVVTHCRAVLDQLTST